MFKLRFFGPIAGQRREFVEAKEFAEISLFPRISELLSELSNIGDVPRVGHAESAYRVIWRGTVKAVQPLLLRSLFWNTVAAIFLLLGVIASRKILDTSLTLSTAVLCCIVVFAGELVKNTVNYFDLLRRAQMARGMQLYLMTLVNRKLAVIDPSISGDLSKGNLKTIISSDVEAVEDFITAATQNWLPTIVILVILTPAIFYSAGYIGLFGVGITLLQVPISVYFAKAIEKYRNRSQAQQDSLTTLVGEWVRNIRLVRYLGWQSAFRKDIAAGMRRYTIESGIGHFINCLTFGISTSWWMVPFLGMVTLSYYLGNPLKLAQFFTSVWALNHITNYVQHLPYSIAMYATAEAGAQRIKRLLVAPELRENLKSDCQAPSVEGDLPIGIHLRNVSVKFGDKIVLDSISTTFSLVQKTAVVGSVGSGKSILLELLIGERWPTSGEIEIEFASGLSVNLWCAEAYKLLRDRIAFVPQQAFLSNASLHSNVSLDNKTSREQVEVAGALAQLSSDVTLFERGYDEEVGETGINLSGGQKQRVSLARAFLSLRPIFVLDDPLSAVDRSTEKILADQIFAHTKGVILVSHRLDELSRCDRLIVLDSGHIIEDGDPKKLLAERGSEFQKLLSASGRAGETA